MIARILHERRIRKCFWSDCVTNTVNLWTCLVTANQHVHGLGSHVELAQKCAWRASLEKQTTSWATSGRVVNFDSAQQVRRTCVKDATRCCWTKTQPKMMHVLFRRVVLVLFGLTMVWIVACCLHPSSGQQSVWSTNRKSSTNILEGQKRAEIGFSTDNDLNKAAGGTKAAQVTKAAPKTQGPSRVGRSLCVLTGVFSWNFGGVFQAFLKY